LKQPGLFLDLAERLPQERCLMVLMRDPAHESLLTAIRTRAASLPNLTLKEDLSLSEVDRLMERAKLFVNTSTYEGFPNTFVQAALRGVPVISCTVDPDAVLSRHHIGLCAGGSFERMVEAIRQLCLSKPAREALSARAQAYAREHHDLERSVRELKRVVCSMTGRTPERSRVNEAVT
jgi:glycosyltransferase involved in cell wall biosynthesis